MSDFRWKECVSDADKKKDPSSTPNDSGSEGGRPDYCGHSPQLFEAADPALAAIRPFVLCVLLLPWASLPSTRPFGELEIWCALGTKGLNRLLRSFV